MSADRPLKRLRSGGSSSDDETPSACCAAPLISFVRLKSEPSRLSSSNPEGDAVVRLNVGGQRFTTARSTLSQVPGSMLAALVSGRFSTTRDAEGAIFIDRSPKHFSTILEFLRHAGLRLPAAAEEVRELETEFDFYGLPFPVDAHLRSANSYAAGIRLSLEAEHRPMTKLAPPVVHVDSDHNTLLLWSGLTGRLFDLRSSAPESHLIRHYKFAPELFPSLTVAGPGDACLATNGRYLMVALRKLLPSIFIQDLEKEHVVYEVRCEQGGELNLLQPTNFPLNSSMSVMMEDEYAYVATRGSLYISKLEVPHGVDTTGKGPVRLPYLRVTSDSLVRQVARAGHKLFCAEEPRQQRSYVREFVLPHGENTNLIETSVVKFKGSTRAPFITTFRGNMLLTINFPVDGMPVIYLFREGSRVLRTECTHAIYGSPCVLGDWLLCVQPQEAAAWSLCAYDLTAGGGARVLPRTPHCVSQLLKGSAELMACGNKIIVLRPESLKLDILMPAHHIFRA